MEEEIKMVEQSGAEIHTAKENRKKLRAWKRRITSPAFYLWFVIGLVFVSVLGILPMYFVYLNNSDTLSLTSFFKPITTSVACYIGAFIVTSFITARASFSALLSGVWMFLLLNFSKISNPLVRLLPANAAYIISIVICLAIMFGSLALLTKLKRIPQLLNVFTLMTTLMLVFVFCVNTVNMWRPIQEELTSLKTVSMEANVHPDSEGMTVNDPSKTLIQMEQNKQIAKESLLEFDLSYGVPNLYFFIFDEMGGFHSIEKYYGYDTTSFRAFLDANNVNYSSTSHSMYTSTGKCITDLLYYTDKAYDSLGRENTRMSSSTPLHKALTEKGYSLFNLSISSRVFRGVPDLLDSLNVVMEHTTEDGLSTADIAYENSILQLILNSRKPFEMKAAETLLTTEEIVNSETFAKLSAEKKRVVNSHLAVFDYFEDPESYIPNAGIGLFSYLKVTHVPFLFNADGSIIADKADYKNWRDTDVYFSCYKYAIAHLEKMIATIIDNDPDSVIIVLGDHGIREHKDCTLQHEFSIAPEDERNVINLLYYRGQDLNIEGLTATNTVRLTLKLLGLDVELQDGAMLDDILQQ